MRVLVVDDHVVCRQVAAAVLRQAGFSVTVAACGAQALAIAVAERPTAMLLDLCLPDIDGFELARRIRAIDGLADVALLAVSGSADRSALQASRAAGFDDHLPKPVDPERLCAAFARAMRRGGPARDLRAGESAERPVPAVSSTDGLVHLDTAEGLRFFAGNRSIYDSALARFASMYATGLPRCDAPGSVSVPGSAFDAAAACRSLHEAAGACAVIGAAALARHAGEAERLVRATGAGGRPVVDQVDRALAALAWRLRSAPVSE